VAQGFKTDDDGEYLSDDKGQKIPRIRQIDDFSEYFVNACTTVADKIPVAGVDAITGHVKMWADKILEGREHPEHLFKVSLADGSTLEGVLHEDFRKGPLDLVGKCMDLESAYKQCPVAPAHARYSPFALKNPESGEVEFFFAKALPFGATAAVHGFNRAAMALNHLVHAFVGIPCTHYFDDFTIVVPEIISSTVDTLARRFFELLGWDVKVSKDKPMSRTFTALGVDFDLTELKSDDPRVVVANKPDRIKEICKKIETHLGQESMTPAEAAELRGRLVLSNSQTYGRMGALAYHYLGRKANKSGDSGALSQDVMWALRWWKKHVAEAKPRTVRVGKQRSPLYVFTDGSCDPDRSKQVGVKAGYRVVMFDPEDGALELFGCEVSDDLMRLLSAGGSKKQIVGQSELIPCHAAKVVWKERMTRRRVVLYVDNEAARFGLIKGSSPTRDSAWLLNEFWLEEAEAESNTWIERVPSASNCADAPSRGSYEILTQMGMAAKRVHLPWDYEKSLVRQWKEEARSAEPMPAR